MSDAGPRGGGGGGGGRRPFFRRRKTCPFSGANAPKIDYKDVKRYSAIFPSAAKSSPVALPQFH